MNSPDSADYIRAQIQSDVTGQVAIGTHILQVGSVHGGFINIAAPAAQPQPKERSSPILLRPRPVSGWLDRQAELETAARGLRSKLPVEISGEPGIGRTALLRRLAHMPELAATHGVVYLNAAGQLVGDLLQSLFDAFYDYPASSKPTPAQLRVALQSRRALVLVDDLDLTREGVERLLDSVPESIVVIADARRTMWAEVQSIELSGLPEAESVQLLERELGRAVSDSERPAALALAAALGGHPIRLLQAGAAARQARATLDEVLSQVESRGPSALTADLVQPLGEDDRKVFGALAAVDMALHVDAVAAISEVTDPAPTLQRLSDRGLILEHHARYAVVPGIAVPPDLVQARDTSRERAITFYSEWADSRADTPEAIAPAADTLLRLHKEAAASGQSRSVLRIGSALGVVLALSGRWETWATVLDRNVAAARAIGDRAAEALTLHESGTRALCIGDTSTARQLLTQAIDIRTTLGDRIGAAVSRHNAGLLSPLPPSDTSSSKPRPAERHVDFDTMRSGEPASTAVVPVAGGSSWATTALLIVLGLVGAGGVAWWVTRDSGATRSETRVPDATPPQQADAGEPTRPGPPVVPPPPAGGPTPAPLATPLTVTVSPGTLDFGTHEMRAPVPPEELIVTNTGSARLPIGGGVVSGPASGDFAVNNDACSSGLAAGESCRLSVTFTPSAEGAREAVLTLKGQGSSEWTARLAGTGAPEARALADLPDAVDFGARTVKTRGDGRTVVITSRGSKALSISTINVSGDNAGDFRIVTNTCTGSELQRGADCKILVGFTPSAIGHRSAQLEVVDNAGQGPHVVSLSGEARAAPVPKARLNPERLEFQRQVVGQPGASRSMRVINEGNGPLSIERVVLEGLHPGDFKIGNNTCAGKSLAPQGMCTVDVTFAPTAGGPRVGLLTVVHNAGDEGRSADLVGSAEPRAVAKVSPLRLDFKEQALGKGGGQQGVTIENVGGDALRVGRVFFAGANPRDFPVIENRCANATAGLKRGESCALILQFSPNEVGSRSGVLVVTTDDGARQEIPVLGVGLGRAEIAVAPTTLEFGSQELRTSLDQSVTIRNSGSATLALGPLAVEPRGASDFVVVDRDGCANVKLEPGRTCTFAVRFTPSAPDVRQATVVVTDAAGSRAVVKLNGTGRARPVAAR